MDTLRKKKLEKLNNEYDACMAELKQLLLHPDYVDDWKQKTNLTEAEQKIKKIEKQILKRLKGLGHKIWRI